MDLSKYSNYDDLFKIGDYKKLTEELKDLVTNLQFDTNLSIDQIIKSCYYFMARLGLGKFSEVEKFLNSKLFEESLLKVNILAQGFLYLIKLNYSYELELYDDNEPEYTIFDKLKSDLPDNDINNEVLALISIYQSYLQYKKGNFTEFEKFHSISKDYINKLENSYVDTIYYLVSSQINGLKGNTTVAIANAQESYEKSVLTKNITLKAQTLLRIADVNYPRGQIQQGLDNCESVFIIGKKLGNVKLQAMSLFINAKICHHTMDLDQALELTNKVKDYFNSFNFTYGLMLLQNLYGNVNFVKGELDRALKDFEKCLIQAEEMDQFTEAVILNNIGNIYNDKGLFDTAIEYYVQALHVSDEINYKWVHSLVLSNLGYSYHLKTDYKKAIEYFTQSLESEEASQPVQKAGTYFNLIIAQLELKNNEETSRHFENLRLLTKTDSNKLIFYYYEISRALIQKNKKGLNNFAEAQETFKRLLRENILHAGLKQIIIINLADLMIKELSLQPTEETLTELNTLIDKLYAHGKEQNIFDLIIEALILKSKITLIEGNIKQAERLLVQASILAEEKNLTYLEKKTNDQYKEFRKEITHWAELIENNTPLVEKMKLSELQNYVSELQKMAFK